MSLKAETELSNFVTADGFKLKPSFKHPISWRWEQGNCSVYRSRDVNTSFRGRANHGFTHRNGVKGDV